MIIQCFAIIPANMLLSAHRRLWVHAERKSAFGANILNGIIIKTISASAINPKILLLIHNFRVRLRSRLLLPASSIQYQESSQAVSGWNPAKNHCPKGLHFLSCKRVLRIYGIFAYEENSPFLVTRLHNYNSISSLSKSYRPHISPVGNFNKF